MFILLGWVGTFFYLFSYFLLSIRKIKGDGLVYHIMNILGAIGLTFNALHLQDYPNVVVNIAWMVIAVVAIYLFVIKRKP